MAKVQRGTIYKTDGSIVKVQPVNGKKFDYNELQLAVGGYIESLIPGIKGCRQMFANEEGLIHRLPPNPHTDDVVNLKVYRLNGYRPGWRVSGNIIAILSEEAEENEQLTIAQAMGK